MELRVDPQPLFNKALVIVHWTTKPMMLLFSSYSTCTTLEYVNLTTWKSTVGRALTAFVSVLSTRESRVVVERVESALVLFVLFRVGGMKTENRNKTNKTNDAFFNHRNFKSRAGSHQS